MANKQALPKALSVIITDMDILHVQRMGYRVERKKYPKASLVEINILGVLHTLWRKYSERNISVTQEQLSNVLGLSKATVWRSVCILREQKVIETYPKRASRIYYVNKEASDYVAEK